MTPTLKVDTAQLAAAGQTFQSASDAVPAAPHDMRLDAILTEMGLTETGLIACDGKGWRCG